MGPAPTDGPVTLMIPQWCTQRMGVKCVQANTCPFRATDCPCTSGCPSDNFRNQGPTRVPISLRLTTNVSDNIEEAQEDAPILCQAIDPVVFHQDAPAFSPSVLPGGDEGPALPARAVTAHTAPDITDTTAPDLATSVTVGSGKIN